MVEWCGAWKEVLVPAVLHPLPKKCSKNFNGCDSLFCTVNARIRVCGVSLMLQMKDLCT